MSTAEVLTPIPRLAVDDWDSDELYEIVDGVRVEMPPMSAQASVLANRLAQDITVFARPNKLGEAYVEVLLKLSLLVDRKRRPDVAFVPYTRWARNRPVPDTNAWDVLPDLCVEVVSPSDSADELTEKVAEYFQAGVRLVWVVYPRQQTVYIYDTSPHHVRALGRDDALDGGAVLPGFRLALAELFPAPEPPAAAP